MMVVVIPHQILGLLLEVSFNFCDCEVEPPEGNLESTFKTRCLPQTVPEIFLLCVTARYVIFLCKGVNGV